MNFLDGKRRQFSYSVKKNNPYHYKRQFLYIKVGCKGYKSHGHVSMINKSKKCAKIRE